MAAFLCYHNASPASLMPALLTIAGAAALITLVAVVITLRCRHDHVALDENAIVISRCGVARRVPLDKIRAVKPRSDTDPIGTLLRLRSLRSVYVPGTIVHFDELAPMLKQMICPASDETSEEMDTAQATVQDLREPRAMDGAGRVALILLALISGPIGFVAIAQSANKQRRKPASHGFKVKQRRNRSLTS